MNVVVSVCAQQNKSQVITNITFIFFVSFTILGKQKQIFFYTGYIQENINKDKAALL